MAEDEDKVVLTADGRRIRPVRSVGRAIELLDVIAEGGETMGLTDLAGAIGCSKTAAYNLLTTLELHGMVRRVDDHRYALGWRLLELGEVVRASSTFGEEAHAQVIALSEHTGETALLAVLDRLAVVCVDVVESSRSVPLSTSRGSREALTVGAPGRVLLAYSVPARRRRMVDQLDPDRAGLDDDLGRVRQQGFAVVVNGLEVAVAAPVFDYSGDVVASIAAVGPASRLPPDRVNDIVALVTTAAAAVSASLGGGVRASVRAIPS
ncbi:MAG: IclR family transcriptional regulator [Ilumatobacteraceae bacterium]